MNATDNLSSISTKQFNGFYIPKHNAKVIKESMDKGTAPFLPKDGLVKAEPLYNANTGHSVSSNSIIPLQCIKQERGYQSNMVFSFNTFNEAKTQIMKDEKPFFYNYKNDNGDIKVSSLFFAEQSSDPKKSLEFGTPKIKEKQLLKDTVIEVNNPSDYMAAYFASCKSGLSFKVSPEIVESFKNDFTKILDNEIAKNKNKEIPSLNTFLFESEKKGKDMTYKLSVEKGIIQPKPEKTQSKKIEKSQENEMVF